MTTHEAGGLTRPLMGSIFKRGGLMGFNLQKGWVTSFSGIHGVNLQNRGAFMGFVLQTLRKASYLACAASCGETGVKVTLACLRALWGISRRVSRSS